MSVFHRCQTQTELIYVEAAYLSSAIDAALTELSTFFTKFHPWLDSYWRIQSLVEPQGSLISSHHELGYSLCSGKLQMIITNFLISVFNGCLLKSVKLFLGLGLGLGP